MKPSTSHIQTPSRRIVLGLAAALAAVCAPVAPARAISANPVPAECRDDAGIALVPEQSPGWLFLVNFNVVTPQGAVRGCMVTSDAAGEVRRHAFDCQVIGAVPIAGGAATLSSQGHVSCPFDIKGGDGIATYDNFWMRARLGTSSAASPAAMSLFAHPSVSLAGSRDATTVRMSSTLNDWPMHTERRNVWGAPVLALHAQRIPAAVAQHYMGDALVNSAPRLQPVLFSTAPVFVTIGQAGPAATAALAVLHELVVDPGGRCCDGG